MRTALLSTLAFTLAVATAPAQIGLQLTTGVDGGIVIPADPLLVPPTGITVEAWITFNDSTIPLNGLFYWPTIVRQNIQNGQEVYNLRVSSGNTGARSLQWTVRVNGQLQSVSYVFAAGEFVPWTHVAATYDGQNLRIYKNGAQVAARTLTTTAELVYSGDVLRIGNGDPVAPGRETWNGMIDELRIWPVARTAGEILSTKNQSLGALPGKLLNFTLDGFEIDISSGLIGATFGTTAYAAGAPLAQLVSTSVSSFGQSTTTCGRSIDALVASVPSIGNADFAIWAARGPRPAQSGVGLLFGAVAQAQPGLPPALGVNVAFDLNSVVYQVAILGPTTLLGNARWPLPLPNDPAFPGATLYFQWAFLDSVCGPQGITASDGLQVTLQ